MIGKLFKKLDEKIIALQCPRYYEDMPETDDSRLWVAAAHRYGIWGDSYPSYDVMIEGQIEAYKTARRFALILDRETPYHRGEVGISWFIRPARPEEIETGFIDHQFS